MQCKRAAEKSGVASSNNVYHRGVGVTSGGEPRPRDAMPTRRESGATARNGTHLARFVAYGGPMRWLLDVLVPQLARPHGALGQLVAAALNRGNRDMNLHVLGALDVAPGERVLELGFGGGVGLALLLAHEPSARLSGID